MKPPWLYRALLNPIRIWLEDRRAPEYGYVRQWRSWWRTDVEHRTERQRPAGAVGNTSETLALVLACLEQ